MFNVCSRAERIVLHIPHSSSLFPTENNCWSEGINKHILHWTDWFTDWIFCSAAGCDGRIVPVSFPFSRFFCDVERLENDPLESVGQGIVYTDFQECHRSITEKDKAALLERYYHPHMDRLKSALSPKTFLVDCHSFPPELSDIEVCLGFNKDWSRPRNSLLLKVEESFRNHGFKTAINAPYSNSMAPKVPFIYRSMMIELNRKTYMSGPCDLDYEKAARVISAIGAAFMIILGK